MRSLLVTSIVGGLLTVASASGATLTTAALKTAGLPGPHNSITDVPGVELGQVQSTHAPYLTGTTVVHAVKAAVAGVDQRGGAPATKETDLLSTENSNAGVNAVMLGGSSMYGLGATDGIIRWLEDRKEGVHVGTGVAPIVPAADIYDLGRGGNFKARTSAAWGYLAAAAAECEGRAEARKKSTMNTTIAVIATNAPLEKAAATRLAMNAHDGMARAISPIHTLDDGDTVFAMSTGTGTPLRVNDPDDTDELDQIFDAGADTLTRAIGHAILAARSAGGARSYCATYPSACRDVTPVPGQGSAPEVTSAAVARANAKLAAGVPTLP
jgi:L-aminopeptidase/D-esterase-like protein